MNSYLIPGRYLFPGLTAFCLLLVFGWSALRRRWIVSVPGWSSVAGLFVLTIFIPHFVLAPLYQRPPTSAVPTTNPLTELVPGIDLINYALPMESIHPGDDVSIQLTWMAIQPIQIDY